MTQALEWTRPLALASLLLPVAVLLLSRRRERPHSVPLGTFALWRGLSAAEGAVRRRRVSAARWAWIASMTAACIALAGPRWMPRVSRAPLIVLVDRSPSMYLEHTLADGRASGRGTRLDAALEDLASWGTLDLFEPHWTSRLPGERVQLDEFPAAWRSPPGGSSTGARDGNPSWAAFDRVGTLWLTDRLGRQPLRAGWVASGGGPAPGPAAREGGQVFDWDGERLLPSDAPAAPREIRLDGELSATVAGLARVWAEARGHAVVDGGAQPSAALSLHVHAASRDPALVLRAARDGWWVDGPVGLAPASFGGVALATWLEAAQGASSRPVVTWTPGHVFVALDGEPLRGDPAAFAISWSRLFDAACRPGTDIVSVAERAAAGAPGFGPPRMPSDGTTRDEGRERASGVPAAWLAVTALALGCIALLIPGAGLR